MTTAEAWQLDLTDGRSDKFYRVIFCGPTVVLRWGRRGTAGQRQVRLSADPAGVAYGKVQAKGDRGYQVTVERLRFDVDVPGSRPDPDRLEAAFEQAMVAEVDDGGWDDRLAAGDLTLVLVDGWDHLPRSLPDAAWLAGRVTDRVLAVADGRALLALPDPAGRALAACWRDTAVLLGPASPDDGPATAETMFDLAGPEMGWADALDAARALTG